MAARVKTETTVLDKGDDFLKVEVLHDESADYARGILGPAWRVLKDLYPTTEVWHGKRFKRKVVSSVKFGNEVHSIVLIESVPYKRKRRKRS